MSDHGVFGVHRGIWDHPLFQERRKKEFSRREAWIWMLSEAAWKPRRARVPGSTFMLARGQFAHSIRFMSKAWGWEQTRVVRFLEQLKSEAMIATRLEAGHTITTICNYDKYQIVGLPDETPEATPIATPAQQDRNTSATGSQHQRNKQEEGKKERREEDSGGGSARASLISQDAHDLAVDLAKICGFQSVDDWPPGWCGSPMWTQKCLNDGWLPDVMRAAAREAVGKKRDGPIEHFKYLEKPLARAHAQHQAPLPKVEIPKQETINGQSRQASKSGGLAGALAKLGCVADELESRRLSEGGEPTPRLLSHG